MLRLLRISALLYLLAFVAVGTWVTSHESTDWDIPLRVHVYAVAGDASATTAAAVERLATQDFVGIERFFASEAERYGLVLDLPFSFHVPAAAVGPLPPLPAPDSRLGTVLWSLEMRWLATRLRWRSSDPLVPDITLFVVYHDGATQAVLDRSTALRKGLIAIANVFAAPESHERNEIVIAHELLHTLGATDKYSPSTHLPIHPEGFAEPTARPRYPQLRAELMAGRRAIDAHTAAMPDGLTEVVVGPATAAEIGWPMPQVERAGL